MPSTSSHESTHTTVNSARLRSAPRQGVKAGTLAVCVYAVRSIDSRLAPDVLEAHASSNASLASLLGLNVVVPL